MVRQYSERSAIVDPNIEKELHKMELQEQQTQLQKITDKIEGYGYQLSNLEQQDITFSN